MQMQQTIKCAFCKGTGNHPYFAGTCPVCKGKGENLVSGKYLTCRDCRGSGRKSGTALTCYTCGGLGVLPDTQEIVAQARQEIKKAREEMAQEKEEFREKPLKNKRPKSLKSQDKEDPIQDGESCFCQSCASKVSTSSAVKVCLDCFRKIKNT